MNTYAIEQIDPYLQPFSADIGLRMWNYTETKRQLLAGHDNLCSLANGHAYFGFHKQSDGYYYREWAPNAQEIALIGDFNGWNRTSHKLKAVSFGVWEIFIPGANALPHGSRVKIEITANGYKFDRIPPYCKRVVQNPNSLEFDGQVWFPEPSFTWTDKGFKRDASEPLLIYEAHIGMAGIREEIASFQHFTDFILPRVARLGYNTLQLMAVMEHPYYGSFGYQVSNFFAVSSRFGTPEELKCLINKAHGMGIAVLLDIVHAHAARNTSEGIGAFDGTDYQFFHSGGKGDHPAWGTKLFNFGKPEVLHFLLSNIKFWLEEYHFDGFRFDGVTSMLYHDHGMGSAFDNYGKYFSYNTDTEAVTYLQLAAELAKEIKPECILIAEDMSGMPGMCLPIADGGIGFDYRLGMGMPDYWIKTLRDRRDEDWDIGQLWHELVQRRPKEKVVGYCESHDQALVGDKTIMFWLADKEMYWHMRTDDQNHVIDRAMALHKMIRLITCTCAGEGYLNFMGNEFGHPEWVDFPRDENGGSYSHARRRWDLADDENLRYRFLSEFDRAMICLVKENNLLMKETKLLLHDEGYKTLVFEKAGFVFAFNFHPHIDCTVEAPVNKPAKYKLKLNSEWERFGGWVSEGTTDKLTTIAREKKHYLSLTINKRSAVVYRKSGQ